MSTLPVDLAIQLGKILPRLDSTHSGEVPATAAALSRKLKSRGYDWHDLVKHIVEGTPPAPSRKPPPSFSYESWKPMWAPPDPMRRHQRQVARCQSARRDRLSPWEHAFIESIAHRLVGGCALTPRQATILQTIVNRLEAWS
jgi:hypothetical protein